MDTSELTTVHAPKEIIRRRRSAEEKRRIVEETLEAGASVARVARRHEVNANQVFYWRGDSDEADRHSELIAISIPGSIRSVVGAKRRWRMDFPESDRDGQACCC